ncbi:MAG TPA: hypothetical protein VK928_04035 [Longimicrobiales bacterium]|nr:hypothetical protein [Longimicrobiales bacterium]
MAVTEHCVEIPVLGIVTRFESNSALVLDVVEEAFGAWRTLPAALVEERTPLTVQVTVRDGEGPGGCDVAHHAPGDGCIAPRMSGGDVAHRLQGDGRLVVHASDVMGTSDPQRGAAVAWVTPASLREGARFRHEVLEALTWALLTRHDRQPLHAAALVHEGVGLLLCGPSGTGKSTLAYAAARSGLRVLAEDTVFVQAWPRPRVWGIPGALHLLPAAAAGFPELSGVTPQQLHTGKCKVVIDTHANGAAAVERVVEVCGVCVIGERRAMAASQRLSGRDAVALLDLAADPGFDAFAHTLPPLLRRLAENGAWQLHPSAAPGESVPLLARMLAELAAHAATRDDAVPA